MKVALYLSPGVKIPDDLAVSMKAAGVKAVHCIAGQRKDEQESTLIQAVAEAAGAKIKKFAVDWKKYGRAGAKLASAQATEGTDEAWVLWDGVDVGGAYFAAFGGVGSKALTVEILNTGENNEFEEVP